MCQLFNSAETLYADASDEPTGDLVHLPRNLLHGNAQKRTKRRRATAGTRDREEASSDEEDSPVVTGSWKKQDPGLIGSKVPDLILPELPPEVVEAAATYTAYDYYKLFKPSSFMDTIVEQSKLYGGQKDMLRQAELVNVNTYR